MDELLDDVAEILERVDRDDATAAELLAAVREALECISEEIGEGEEEEEDDDEEDDEELEDEPEQETVPWR